MGIAEMGECMLLLVFMFLQVTCTERGKQFTYVNRMHLQHSQLFSIRVLILCS